jgi:hypothetical protein
MSVLTFAIDGARGEKYAVVPTIALRLRVDERSGTPVHAIALRCQIMIEPQRRRYDAPEHERLVELFGEPSRWGDTVRPFLWTNVALTVPGFSDTIEVELPIVCTYDLEVAASKYFHALDNGEIPILVLFSGTVFARSPTGLNVLPVPWNEEARFRLPARVWRETIDQYFPNSGWLRLQRSTIDALQRFKTTRALPTWDDALVQLLKEAGEDGA